MSPARSPRSLAGTAESRKTCGFFGFSRFANPTHRLHFVAFSFGIFIGGFNGHPGRKLAKLEIANTFFEHQREERKRTRLVLVFESVAFREFLFSFRVSPLCGPVVGSKWPLSDFGDVSSLDGSFERMRLDCLCRNQRALGLTGDVN